VKLGDKGNICGSLISDRAKNDACDDCRTKEHVLLEIGNPKKEEPLKYREGIFRILMEEDF